MINNPSDSVDVKNIKEIFIPPSGTFEITKLNITKDRKLNVEYEIGGEINE